MIGIYPEQSVPFHHPLHENVPAGDRPTFHARFITARESIKVDAHVDAAFRAESADDAQQAGGEHDYDPTHRLKLIDELVAILRLSLAGWDGLTAPDGTPVPFTDDGFAQLPDLFELPDLWDLYASAISATRVRRDDLKKSASPSHEAGDGSAPTANAAAAASGDASTSPPPASPPSSPASPATTTPPEANPAPTAADQAKN